MMRKRTGRMFELAIAIGLLGCLQACSEDDATQPPPRYDLATPVGVADALRTMLADRDTAAIANVLAPDVAFVVNPFEAETMDWPAEITSRELDRALRNLMTGTVTPPVTTVAVASWTPVGSFAAADPNSPFPGTLEADYVVGLVFERAGDEALVTRGTLRLSVAQATKDASATAYVLAGWQEIAASGGNRSLGAVLVEYLANRPPATALTVEPEAGESPRTFTFDVSATTDPDESAGLLYSWGGDLESGGWSDWTSDLTTTRTWYPAGTYVAKARAKDRWGLVAIDSLACTVATASLPFADTPDRLVDNFLFTYQAMDIDLYRDDILSENYIFLLQAETVEEFELQDNIYEYDDELAIAQKMFSGQPDQNGVVLSTIEIQSLQPQGGWYDVPANDPYFGGYPGARFRNYNILSYFNAQSGWFRYEVQGNVLFYVTSEEVMHDGVLTPQYRLLGQLDQTSFWLNGKATESTTWSDVKAMFE